MLDIECFAYREFGTSFAGLSVQMSGTIGEKCVKFHRLVRMRASVFLIISSVRVTPAMTPVLLLMDRK